MWTFDYLYVTLSNMNQSDDDILFTDSRNLDDNKSASETEATTELRGSYLNEMLEGQGVSIIDKESDTEKIEPLEQLSRELMDEAGIEIIESEE